MKKIIKKRISLPVKREELWEVFPSHELNLDSLDIKEGDGIETVQKIELALANAAVKAVVSSWGRVKSLAGVTMMLRNTFDALKERRNVLGLPYGAKRNVSEGGSFFTLD